MKASLTRTADGSAKTTNSLQATHSLFASELNTAYGVLVYAHSDRGPDYIRRHELNAHIDSTIKSGREVVIQKLSDRRRIWIQK